MYLGRSFSARLVAKIGVVFEKRKSAGKVANFVIEVLPSDELDEGLDGVDVRGDELARFDHVAVLEHDAGRPAFID